jgi:hypothetical protein
MRLGSAAAEQAPSEADPVIDEAAVAAEALAPPSEERDTRNPEQDGYSELRDRLAAALQSPPLYESLSDPLAAFRRSDEPRRDPPAMPSRPGFSSIFQEALANPDGNAALSGPLSMNTTAWINGFWMQRFRRDVSAKWVAPYAYNIGMIHGWTVVHLEVDRSGELLSLAVIDEAGHYTLKDASILAIQDSAPFLPLPTEFPEETFVVRIKMVYADYNR